MGVDASAILPFHHLAGDPPPADELVAPGDMYACVTGQRQAIAIRFIWKDGRTLSIPYAFLPIVWGGQPHEFIIEFHHLFSILVRGKELTELQRRLEEHRVIWIRECDRHQADAMACAVTGIEILRLFPSREAGR